MEYLSMKKTIKILVPLLMVVLILVSIGWYLFVYDRSFTRDTLLSQARFQDANGNSRLSSWFYNMAYSFSGKDENVAIELANQYKAAGNYTKAEYTLTNALNGGATVELYTALCRTYVEQNKILDAVNMLDNIGDPAIKAELDALRPSAPQPDQESGYYSQYIELTLTSSGTILYTTDGEFPSTEGPIYTAPIQLSAGETTIYAISVNNDGLVSPMTVLGYTITGVIEEVYFSDEALASAIRTAINVSADSRIYTNQLWEITEFTVPEEVKNYEDLSLLPYLKTLTIHGQTLDSLSCLASLTQLETLDMTSCHFPADSLTVLAGLPVLTNLTLNDCSLSTIEGLTGAPNLKKLDLSNNTVRNLDAISSMAGLQELILQHNAVTSLSALSGLTALEKLDVSYNSLTTLSPLSSCIKLNWLGANSNQLSDLAGVSSLPLLTYLSLDSNTISDVSSLAGCGELTELSFAGNQVTDISALSSLSKLEVFDFSNNQVEELPQWPDSCPLRVISGSHNVLTSIDSLSNMESLTNVNMDYNQLTNIDALADNYCLVQVNVFGNTIEDVSALREHDIIVNYDPTAS